MDSKRIDGIEINRKETGAPVLGPVGAVSSMERLGAPPSAACPPATARTGHICVGNTGVFHFAEMLLQFHYRLAVPTVALPAMIHEII